MGAILSTALAVGVASTVAAQNERSAWSIGPVIRGENYSFRMPAAMRPSPAGSTFDFPYPTARDGHVHYVTTPTRSLANASRITLRYRIDTAPGTRFVPEEHPDETATLSLYFQRAGDRWTMRTPHHRWYSPTEKVVPLSAGTHTISIALDEAWIAMAGGSRNTLLKDFDRALAQANTVGFVFGSASGRGHGVYATGPARFTLLDFEIE
ncbi:hypothetical protein [Citromicrobium bathyomarinum]|uniref:hypothetical protein n=1 Tax=Citromicrobium bathyomarinum TaxID=72174 RepID=UPI00315B0D78